MNKGWTNSDFIGRLETDFTGDVAKYHVYKEQGTNFRNRSRRGFLPYGSGGLLLLNKETNIIMYILHAVYYGVQTFIMLTGLHNHARNLESTLPVETLGGR